MKACDAAKSSAGGVSTSAAFQRKQILLQWIYNIWGENKREGKGVGKRVGEEGEESGRGRGREWARKEKRVGEEGKRVGEEGEESGRGRGREWARRGKGPRQSRLARPHSAPREGVCDVAIE